MESADAAAVGKSTAGESDLDRWATLTSPRRVGLRRLEGTQVATEADPINAPAAQVRVSESLVELVGVEPDLP